MLQLRKTWTAFESKITPPEWKAERLVIKAKELERQGMHEEAIPLYQEAADLGNAEAQNNLGCFYFMGHRDTNKAVHYFRLSAKQNYPAGQYNFAVMHYDGDGENFDDRIAFNYCKQSAEQGYPTAICGLGIAYFEGRGVTQNYGEAVKYFESSADKGHAPAFLWLLKCAEELDKKGLRDEALRVYGVVGNNPQAVEYFEQSAAQGNSGAQYHLGQMYAKGQGVTQNNPMAAQYVELSAMQGNPDAQFDLGCRYAEGLGVERNVSRANHFLDLSEKQGNLAAKLALGKLYETFGNYLQAFNHYADHALKGYPLARKSLEEFLTRRYEAGDINTLEMAILTFDGKKDTNFALYTLHQLYELCWLVSDKQNGDYKKSADDFLKQAADRGDNDARQKLGMDESSSDSESGSDYSPYYPARVIVIPRINECGYKSDYS